MNCLRPDRLDLYLEGEIQGAERREFEKHLASCAACREALEDLRLFDRAFSTLPPVEIPENFAAAILARLPKERRSVWARFGWAVGGAAGLFAALLGYFLLTGESLLGVLTSLGRTVMGVIGLAVPILARLFKLAGVFLNLAGNFGAAAMKSAGLVSPFLKPEVIGVVLALGLGLSLFLVFGVKMIVALGEKS